MVLSKDQLLTVGCSGESCFNGGLLCIMESNNVHFDPLTPNSCFRDVSGKS